jgi:hypothetical protein
VLGRGEILGGRGQAGLGGGNLWQAAGLAFEELSAGLSGGAGSSARMASTAPAAEPLEGLGEIGP